MDSSVLVIIIIFAALALFITELIPLPVTAMAVAVSFYLIGVVDADTALKAFSSGTVMIISSMAIIGEAVFETGGADKAGKLLMRFAENERNLVFIIVIFSGVISGFLSNTGAAALLITFALGICSSTKIRRSKLMYPVVVGCSFGGGLTIVGTTSGPFLKETMDSLNIGETMNFFEFAPLSILLLLTAGIYMYFIGYKLLPDNPKNYLKESKKIDDFSNIPKWKTNLSFCLLIGTLIGMIFEKRIGISLHFIAIIGAMIAISAKCVTVKVAFSAIPISGIIVYAAMVPLSNAMVNSGAADIIAESSLRVLGNIKNPVIILCLIFMIITPITNFMSNAATIILFTPIAIVIAETLGMNIKGMLVAIRFAASIAVVTPIATPANSMALEPGGYRFVDFIIVGLPLAIISVIICIVYITVMYSII